MTLQLTYRNKIILWISLTSIAVIVCITAIIWPTQAKLKGIKADMAIAEQQIQNDTLSLQQAISHQKQASAISEAVTDLRTAYISQDNPIDFISRLEQLADQHQVVLDVNADTPTNNTSTGSTHTDVNLRLSLTGSLDHTFAFIDELMRDPTYINITNLSMAPAPGGNDEIIITIETLTYWR